MSNACSPLQRVVHDLGSIDRQTGVIAGRIAVESKGSVIRTVQDQAETLVQTGKSLRLSDVPRIQGHSHLFPSFPIPHNARNPFIPRL